MNNNGLQAQINALNFDIDRLKAVHKQYDANFANLTVRTEITVSLIAALINSGLIDKAKACEFVKTAPLNLPGHEAAVEGAKQTIIQILSSAKPA
ncbi:hypothetical protein LU196_13030 [Pantoea sp. Mb-10]|uniref:hypothetical protein n=1 Tax=unclassified Pantoea TaxID=2630326 RepID=UPI001E2F1EEE|nr:MULTISPECIES: hypothetical protein [unclassified Pantoea]MCE0490963.1 hypothetical protein [Pantoea sp. Mb-10]MCE0499879.1 hypothetical protein [Pantoea sp. Pb-8]